MCHSDVYENLSVIIKEISWDKLSIRFSIDLFPKIIQQSTAIVS